MRFKLGLLQDTATIEKQAAREAAEAQAKKHRHDLDETSSSSTKEKDKDKDSTKSSSTETRAVKVAKPKIRPLSEAKAIDAGANFVSETFLLLVGAALIVGEQWRRKRQTREASSQAENEAERHAELLIRSTNIVESCKRELARSIALDRVLHRVLTGKPKIPGEEQYHIWLGNLLELARQEAQEELKRQEEQEKKEEERHPKVKTQTWTQWIRTRTLGDEAPTSVPEIPGTSTAAAPPTRPTDTHVS